jgi:ketosteroid isomerase-like protein
LNSLKSKERTFDSKTINEMRIQLLGNVAVVYGLSTVKSTLQGKDTSGQYRWTDVLAKRNGQWQAVTSQSTKVIK